MSRERPFPVYPGDPADDETIVYRIFPQGTAFDSNFLVIGETVFLSDEGIEVVASADGNYADQNAYTFRDSDGRDVGGLYGREPTLCHFAAQPGHAKNRCRQIPERQSHQHRG